MVRSLAVLLLAAVACAPAPPASAPHPDAPFMARIHAVGSGMRRVASAPEWLEVSINRPAYVAVYEVRPGSGVLLLHDGEARESSIHLRSRFITPSSPSLWRWADGPRSYAPWTYGGPRLLLLVASEAPLDVQRFRHDPYALRRELGFQQAISYDASATLSRLVDVSVPAGYEGEIATDVWLDWPTPVIQEPPTYAILPDFLTITCASGEIVRVPRSAAMAGRACTREGRTPEGDGESVGRPDSRRPPPPGDSATVRRLPADESLRRPESGGIDRPEVPRVPSVEHPRPEPPVIERPEVPREPRVERPLPPARGPREATPPPLPRERPETAPARPERVHPPPEERTAPPPAPPRMLPS
jgi:hypothetical protein